MQENIPGTPATPAPAATPPAPAAGADTAALQAQVAEMAKHIQTLTTNLNEAINTPAPEPAPAKPAPASKGEVDAYLDRLASQPRETISEEAKQAAMAVVKEAVGPTLSRIFDFGGSLVMEREQARVDEEFGTGTFQELYAPALQRDLANLKRVNPEATANQETVRALVDRITGQQFSSLATRKEAAVKARNEARQKQAEELVSHIPQGGVRLRGRVGTGGGLELPAEFDQFSREIAAATGEPIDRETFAKLYHAGNTIDDFLKATGQTE